ncbi:MAG TPA: hypothetical protein VFS10_18140 [Pyrinomonadaceae bacterium]|nr:hypothetical protein [Pyrinomonadaceae bacterium]
MSKRISELFTTSAHRKGVDWNGVVKARHCSYLGRTCIKNRKSRPDIAIGTCTIGYDAKTPKDVIICPHRLLERKQIFTDCYHLLTLHEPGNELHRLGEISIPGGSVDYMLISAKVNGGNRKVVDFVGIELQTLDTTGTVWPERERFLNSVGVPVNPDDVKNTNSYGMNWKMTAKTILMQLHHKVKTFEHMGKHFVLVMQNHLLDYMEREFDFSCIRPATVGDSMHFHAYSLNKAADHYYLQLDSRKSTDSAGIAACLGQKADPKVELTEMIKTLESGLSGDTLLTV